MIKTYCLLCTEDHFPEAFEIIKKLHEEKIFLRRIHDAYDSLEPLSYRFLLQYKNMMGFPFADHYTGGCKKPTSDSWGVYAQRLSAEVILTFHQTVDVYIVPDEFAVNLLKAFKFTDLDISKPRLISITPQYSEITNYTVNSEVKCNY